MDRDALSALRTERGMTSVKKDPHRHTAEIPFTLHIMHNWDVSGNKSWFCKAEGLVTNYNIA